MNEEESWDRKQSEWDRRKGEGRRIKTRKEGHARERRKRERRRRGDEERTKPGAIARSEDPPLAAAERAEKKRRGPRSVLPVRIPTGSLAIQARKRREQGGRKIKGSIFPSKREYPRRAKSRRSGKIVSTTLIRLIWSFEEILFDHLS